MADLIDRKELRDALYEADAVTMQGVKIINQFPAVDAVPVVRCLDCKHWLKDVTVCSGFVGRCDFAHYMVGAKGYCSYGERKDGDGNG